MVLSIAIEFLPDKPVKKVEYRDKLYTIGMQKYEKRAELLVKLKAWKHDEEYRYISEQNDEIYLTGQVKSLIFGIRTPDVVKQLLC